MKQDCRNLEPYIARGLAPEGVVQFETHLLACERCQRELEYLQATIQGIKSYPPLEVRPDLADNVMARIEGTASPWDFSQAWGFVTGVLRDLSSGQLKKFPKAFAAMIVGLICLPPRIYLCTATITFRRTLVVLTPAIIRASYLTKVQVNQPIMNSLRRYTPFIFKNSRRSNNGHTNHTRVVRIWQ